MFNVYTEGDLVRIPEGAKYYSCKHMVDDLNSYREQYTIKENSLGIYAGLDESIYHKVLVNEQIIYLTIDDIHEGDTYVDTTNRGSRGHNNKEIFLTGSLN